MEIQDAKQARPHCELIAELLDSRQPKTEREHAAVREIERLRAELAECMKACRIGLEALELHAKQYPHMQKGYTVDAKTELRAVLQAARKGEGDG